MTFKCLHINFRENASATTRSFAVRLWLHSWKTEIGKKVVTPSQRLFVKVINSSARSLNIIWIHFKYKCTYFFLFFFLVHLIHYNHVGGRLIGGPLLCRDQVIPSKLMLGGQVQVFFNIIWIHFKFMSNLFKYHMKSLQIKLKIKIRENLLGGAKTFCNVKIKNFIQQVLNFDDKS